jgi:PTS system mannose-specific IIA component
MRPIVITAHGSLASALLSTTEMILGPTSGARAVDFEVGMGVPDLQRRVEAAVEELAGEGRVLLLADIAGGSPSRVAATIALGGDVDVLTGVNLPMVIAALTEADALESVIDAARSGIGPYEAVRPSGGLK